MCGILAILGAYSPIPDTAHLHRRGPGKNITMITPYGLFSLFGGTPIKSGKKLLLADAEIYNHKELEIQYGLECKSGNDWEVILRLYEKFGFIEAVKKLQGVFAIVLADGEDVYIARDSIGVRPLYLGVSKSGTYYLSSLPQVLDQYCDAIVSIAPGLSGVCRKTGLAVLARGNAPSGISLENAIQKRLYSKEPVCCILSGDVRTCIVASILAKQIRKLPTYSIGISGGTELDYPRKVAELLGTEHTEVVFTPEEGIAVIPEVIKVLGSYDVSSIRAGVRMYLLSRYIGQDQVVFSGEGVREVYMVDRCGLKVRLPMTEVTCSIPDLLAKLPEQFREGDIPSHEYIENHTKTLGITEGEWYKQIYGKLFNKILCRSTGGEDTLQIQKSGC